MSGATVLSNRFIDTYMGNANDAQIKIYLYLLRCIGGNLPVSVSAIADFFNYTEKDVLRALKYWEKQKLLKLSFTDAKQLTRIELLPIQAESAHPVESSIQTIVPMQVSAEQTGTEKTLPQKKPEYDADKLAAFQSDPAIEQFLFVAEQYMQKTLNTNEISSFLYMYDALGFDADLLEYLVEYCVSNRKKSVRYMESVANTWAAQRISCVEDAKEYTSNIPAEFRAVFKAFGIRFNRMPLETELAYIRRWKALGFDVDLMTEACTRTILATHNPSFDYADKIISNWSRENVRTMEDVERLDRKHRQRSLAAVPVADHSEKRVKNASGRFQNFQQRTYDYAALEQEAYLS
ncbi:MAG: DnaD domain protein [Lachnospiraceae bacterium]|nr:DnaD domain protein [Lachnospiraceae bacterium]